MSTIRLSESDLRRLIREELDQATRIAPDMPPIPRLRDQRPDQDHGGADVAEMIRPIIVQVKAVARSVPPQAQRAFFSELQRQLQRLSA